MAILIKHQDAEASEFVLEFSTKASRPPCAESAQVIGWVPTLPIEWLFEIADNAIREWHLKNKEGT